MSINNIYCFIMSTVGINREWIITNEHFQIKKCSGDSSIAASLYPLTASLSFTRKKYTSPTVTRYEEIEQNWPKPKAAPVLIWKRLKLFTMMVTWLRFTTTRAKAHKVRHVSNNLKLTIVCSLFGKIWWSIWSRFTRFQNCYGIL